MKPGECDALIRHIHMYGCRLYMSKGELKYLQCHLDLAVCRPNLQFVMHI